MSWPETAVTAAAVFFAATALSGLIVRRRTGVCRTFVLYLGIIAVADLLMLLWPDRFWRLWFYVNKELVIDLLRFAVALELTYRTFQAFPSARATARGVLLVVLLITLAIVFAGTADLVPPDGAPTLGPLLSRVQPRVLNGTVWLLTGVAGLILWYRLPVHQLHKAILIGLVPYLLVSIVSLNLIESQGWNVRAQVNYLHTLFFLAVLGYWAVVAWRPAEAPILAPDPEPSFKRVIG
jgi:hypothetical protein